MHGTRQIQFKVCKVIQYIVVFRISVWFLTWVILIYIVRSQLERHTSLLQIPAFEVKLFARCSLLVSFCSLLVTFCSLLVSFCSLLVTFCSLLVTFCSLFFRPNYCEIKLPLTAKKLV